MAETLTRHAFTGADWPAVQGFDCGDEPHEKEVASWLKGPATPGVDSALNSINHPDRPGRVWLYVLGEEIVGFGALASELWSVPLGAPVLFQPAVVRGQVFVGTANGTLFGLETGDPADDGWRMWGATPAHNGGQ